MPDVKTTRSFVTAQQVAALAGVSRSAVSRTFTNGASVSDGTRRKVMEAAEQLGYHVNHLARSLIHDSSGIVCIIGADLNLPYPSKILDAITRRLQSTNRVAMVINTSGETNSVEAALRQTLNYRADATLVLSGAPPASLIETCVRSGQHVILINRDDRHSGSENIYVDNVTACREAFHMLRRAGCRNMAVVSSSAGTPSITTREKAFEQAAAEHDLSVRVIRTGPTGYESGYEAGRQILAGSERPDAAFCVTDLLACGFMDAARKEFGIPIPDELCVVGFDDIEQAAWGSYALTTFRQPIEQMADHIATLLDESEKGIVSEPTAKFQAVPVWRKTVRPGSAPVISPRVRSTEKRSDG
ncbi:substrate-binding domain-containing protein [Mesorhizobium sp. BE184]|uniref:LacI family DNA-binding transcriptional regulator n=1 Tax=Mesorhizobium sp. BE184 TaxID=2817714 RepID=UPI002856F9AC|nr:substrate-binding domain-containing protein [Mesorhizobium sp. BE184]MDR7033731.1 DNA-binding LacI/PurR family transcriptional regulator [Mesorhizobium sp. BE184]